MDASDFFNCCLTLDLSQEIARRNHASRQYYGLFHSIKEAFPEMPQYTQVGTHQAVSEYLEKGYSGNEHDRKELKKLSYMMKQAKEFRVTADYLLDKPFTEQECDSARQSVAKCLQKLAQIKSE